MLIALCLALQQQVGIERFQSQVPLGSIIARGSSHIVSLDGDQLSVVDQKGKPIQLLAIPKQCQIMGIDPDDNAVFGRRGELFASNGKSTADPVYAPLGMWGNTIISRVAPNEITITERSVIKHVFPFPKDYVYACAAFDPAHQTLALLLSDASVNSLSLCIMRSPYKESKWVRGKGINFLPSIDFDDQGNVVILRPHPTKGNLWDKCDLLSIDPSKMKTKILATLPVIDLFTPSIAALRGTGKIFVREAEKSGWLITPVAGR